MPRKHVYGPVPSRRLRRSLGIDPVPLKTCTFDCIYCQLGPTTLKTCERREYIPAAEIIADLQQWKRGGGTADYITVAGSGEPTLSTALGDIIRAARSIAPECRTAVLTNGSLFWDVAVREAVAAADVLIPSLDAARTETFARINRPAQGLSLERIIEGLRAARQELNAEMWLEVMLVRGMNDAPEELQALKAAIDYIEPHRVHLNTVVRPPAEVSARPLEPAALLEIAGFLGPRAEIIAPLPQQYEDRLQTRHDEKEVLELLRRRPCTLDDIAAGLGMHRNEATKYVTALVDRGQIRSVRRQGRVFYILA